MTSQGPPELQSSHDSSLDLESCADCESADQYMYDCGQEEAGDVVDQSYSAASTEPEPSPVPAEEGDGYAPEFSTNDDIETVESSLVPVPAEPPAKQRSSPQLKKDFSTRTMMSRWAMKIASGIRDLTSDDASAEQGHRNAAYSTDPLIKSKNVPGLNRATFNGFLKNKDAALVFFYNSSKLTGSRAEMHSVSELAKAAKSTERYNAGFAAVDCAFERDLCQQQSVEAFPLYKLYSKGNSVGSLRRNIGASHSLLKNYIELFPTDEEAPHNSRACTKRF